MPGDTWPERSETRAFFLCRNHMLLSCLSSSLPLLGPSPAEFPGAPPWAVPPPSVYTPWAISGLQEPSTGNCCHPVSSRGSSAERQTLPPAAAHGTATRESQAWRAPFSSKPVLPRRLSRPNRTAIPPLPESGTSAPSPPGFVHPPERGSLQDRAPASLSSPVSSRWCPHRHSPSRRDHLTAVPGMSHARSLSLSFLPESSRNCASNIFHSWILAYLNLTQRPFSSHLKCQLF